MAAYIRSLLLPCISNPGRASIQDPFHICMSSLNHFPFTHFPLICAHRKMSQLPGPLQKTLGTGAVWRSISPTIFMCPYFMASVRAVVPVLSLTSTFTPFREAICILVMFILKRHHLQNSKESKNLPVPSIPLSFCFCLFKDMSGSTGSLW